MGFEQTMNSIIENLPEDRRTLLFSATQTKLLSLIYTLINFRAIFFKKMSCFQKRSVKDLARLSLKDPLYVSVHEHSTHSTPEALQQSYVICNLEEKMSMLWSFIRHHLKQKVIVFFSSCKQVVMTVKFNPKTYKFKIFS